MKQPHSEHRPCQECGEPMKGIKDYAARRICDECMGDVERALRDIGRDDVPS